MVTPTSSLISDITAGQTTIDLKHNVASFTSGTYLYLESAPGGVAQIEAMKITSASPSAVTGPPAGWRYTVTRGLNTSGAKTWLAGDAVVSLGAAVSEGYIDLASVQTVKPISPTVQKVGPTITIYSRSSTSNWDDLVPTVTMGNLTSFVDYSSTRYGFATGNDLTLAPDAGFSGLTADRALGVRLFNTALNLYNVGNAILSIDKTNGISFEFGTALFNTIGWYEDLGIPPASPAVSKLLATVGVARATLGYTELDLVAQGIAGSYTVGAVKLRAIDSTAGQYNVWVDSSGAYFGSGSGVRSQTGGFIKDAVQYLSGNVGIGATDPYSTLEVHSTSTAAARGLTVNQNSGNNASAPILQFQKARNTRASKTIVADGDFLMSFGAAGWDGSAWLQSANIVAQVIGTPAAGAIPAQLSFRTAASGAAVERMVISPDGFVGVNQSAPGALMHLGPWNPTLNTYSGNGLWIAPGQTTATIAMRTTNNVEGGLFLHSSNNMYLGTWTTHPLVFRTNNADRMTILAGGNVGIGIASPDHSLHIYDNSTAIAAVGLKIQQAGAGDARLQFTQQTTNWTIGIDGSVGDSFAISPSTDLSTVTGITIETTGWLGINNNNPGALLHIGSAAPTIRTDPGIWVAPSSGFAALTLRNSGGIEGGLLAATSSVYVGSWSNHSLILRTNNADRLTVSVAGLVTIPGGINLGNTTLSDYAETPVAYTPVVSATTTAPTVGYGARHSNYTRIGNMVMFNAYIPVTSRTGGTGNMTVSLPPSQPARAGSTQIVSAAYFDGTIWNTTKATLRTSDCTVGAGANGADLTITNVLAGHTVAVWGTYFV
jgi:hypothetical protein